MNENNRSKWEFHYQAATLAEAATKKRDHHKARFTWWENKKKEVMDKVRASGIEVVDSVAASYSNTKGAFGPEIRIDDTLQRDLIECQQKLLEHNNKVTEYDGWRQVLTGNPHDTLKLTHNDWLYFFGE